MFNGEGYKSTGRQHHAICSWFNRTTGEKPFLSVLIMIIPTNNHIWLQKLHKLHSTYLLDTKATKALLLQNGATLRTGIRTQKTATGQVYRFTEQFRWQNNSRQLHVSTTWLLKIGTSTTGWNTSTDGQVYIAGVEYAPVKGIQITPNICYSDLKTGNSTTSLNVNVGMSLINKNITNNKIINSL